MAFNYPWTNLHELNLNWVLNQIRKLSQQVTNVVGMTATAHPLPDTSDPTVDVTGGNGNDPYNFDFGIPAGGGGGDVLSVNGRTGVVVLDKDDVGLTNVDNVAQYSASNPPPYPVTSVNGMTGDVVVSGSGSSGTKQTANIISMYPNDITVQSAYKMVIGDLISYIVKFRNSKSANLNYGVLSGFEKPMTTGSGQGAGVILVNTDGHIYHAVISASGRMDIPSNAGIPLGDYTATTTYIKQ